MHIKRESLKFSIAAILIWSTGAAAAPFTLTPPASTPTVTSYGISSIGPIWGQPSNPSLEDHYIEVTVSASSLLQANDEHIAISAFAKGQPFNSNGTFKADASNGGIGIAMGTIGHAFHPACASDPTNAYVEFGIEQFGWQSTSSTIVECIQISKAQLAQLASFKIVLLVGCTFNLCNVSASVNHPTTGATIGDVYAFDVPLNNPTTTRNSWYAVTKFGSTIYSATFDVLSDVYSG